MWCKTVFSSRRAAHAHVQGAYQHMRCLIDNTSASWPLQFPASFGCPMCEFVPAACNGDQTAQLHLLNTHIVTHIPAPHPVLYLPGLADAHTGLSDGLRARLTR
eukprot:3097676-Amphidinium_carterae.1